MCPLPALQPLPCPGPLVGYPRLARLPAAAARSEEPSTTNNLQVATPSCAWGRAPYGYCNKPAADAESTALVGSSLPLNFDRTALHAPLENFPALMVLALEPATSPCLGWPPASG